MRRWVVTVVWIGLLALLTYGLLSPKPIPDEVERQLGPSRSYTASKFVHIGAYGVLAGLAVALPLSSRWRFLPLLLLAGHGAATEYLQQFVGRGSSLTDVGFDYLGIAIGVTVTWPWWRRP
jgi:VanZ family protein